MLIPFHFLFASGNIAISRQFSIQLFLYLFKFSGLSECKRNISVLMSAQERSKVRLPFLYTLCNNELACKVVFKQPIKKIKVVRHEMISLKF